MLKERLASLLGAGQALRGTRDGGGRDTRRRNRGNRRWGVDV